MNANTQVLPVSVPFRNTTLLLIDHASEPFVSMKPVVEGMGLAWQPQHDRSVSAWGEPARGVPDRCETDRGETTMTQNNPVSVPKPATIEDVLAWQHYSLWQRSRQWRALEAKQSGVPHIPDDMQ